jgi:hypothetical protein
MSVRVMDIVWRNYPKGGSHLLALLALADWGDDNGMCYPSMTAIAQKVRLSRPQARRVVHSLIDEGFVSVVGNEAGGAPGMTRKYRINLGRLAGGADAARRARVMDSAVATGRAGDTGSGDTGSGDTGSAGDTGRTDAQDGSHGRAETGITHATQTVIEPSGTVTTREQARAQPMADISKKKSGTTLQKFLDACAASGEKPIPADDPVFDYAAKVGIDEEMLAICWQEFKSRHLPAAKRQKDWRAHFRNAVHRNWYNLWFLKEGEAARWTTAGEQARRAAA